MFDKFLKSFLMGVLATFLVAGSGMALPSEYGVINPGSLVANSSQVLDLMDAYWNTPNNGPAYFIWTEDESRTKWNMAWTGGYRDAGDTRHDNFFGFIELENATTGAVDKVSWDSNDTASLLGTSMIKFDAWALNYYDGISFTITDYMSPSYVGFDLAIFDTATNQNGFDANNVFFGLGPDTLQSMQLQAGHTPDQDFAIASPVPEPATMMLFGIGLLGIAGISRRKLKN